MNRREEFRVKLEEILKRGIKRNLKNMQLRL